MSVPERSAWPGMPRVRTVNHRTVSVGRSVRQNNPAENGMNLDWSTTAVTMLPCSTWTHCPLQCWYAMQGLWSTPLGPHGPSPPSRTDSVWTQVCLSSPPRQSRDSRVVARCSEIALQQNYLLNWYRTAGRRPARRTGWVAAEVVVDVELRFEALSTPRRRCTASSFSLAYLHSSIRVTLQTSHKARSPDLWSWHRQDQES